MLLSLSESTADDDRPKRFGGRVFGRMVLGKMGRKMCMGGSAIAESRDDDENECPEGDLMDVFVPPGKLGIIIDTPDDGPPTVHVVKETSAVRDRIHVGDKLIAVDDEDVQEMTATQVSKIISNKSFNSQRKFTIVRPYDVINI